MADSELTINYTLKFQDKCDYSDRKGDLLQDAGSIWEILKRETKRARILEILKKMVETGSLTVQIKDNEKRKNVTSTKDLGEVVIDENDVATLFDNI